VSRTIADLIQERFGLPTEAGRGRPAEGPLALLLSHRTQRRYKPDPIPDDVLEMALAAERLSFNNIWLAEHHFSTYGYLSRPVQLATYLAARTTRIRVGTAVIVVPLHHPLVVAEEIATLSLLAPGRLDIGLGRGYQHYEFERFGLELEQSRDRWEESVDVILKALAGGPFTYDGKFFKIPETSVFPQPVQRPHPPIWVTAQSLESVEAAVMESVRRSGDPRVAVVPEGPYVVPVYRPPPPAA